MALNVFVSKSSDIDFALIFWKNIEIKEAFDVYDTDGSGEITSSEILQVLKELGLHSESGDVDAMMKEFDRNKDGKVTFPGEFI